MRALLAALLFAAAPWLATCAPPAGSEPALWRLRDANSEIWLFGTAHMLDPRLRWRGPRFEAAFTSAEELITELDTGPAAAAELQALSHAHGALPEGETLAARLAPRDAERLARVAQTVNTPQAELAKMRPWLAALRLSYAYSIAEGLRPEAGVETILVAEARSRRMRLSALETPAQQIAVLADLPEAVQVRFLNDTLREIESGAAPLGEIDEAWARGDTRALARLFDAQWREGPPALHEAIILARNRAWAEQIVRRLDGEGRIFVAVGAAHLVGEGNLIDLLRARGLQVDEVP